MKDLQYKINIAATPQKVWDTMTGKETYKEWTATAWPGSDFKGEWKQGENLQFIGNEDGAGTLATVTTFDPYKKILLAHIALLLAGGVEDKESEWAQKWVGSTEAYIFAENNGTTELTIDMQIYPEWADMFNESWPKALNRLKEICEV